MAVSQIVIDAYKSAYTLQELKVMLRKALEDRASGVQVTQINFQDGGGAGQVIGGDPNEVIEILKSAISQMEGGGEGGGNPMMSGVNFSMRRCET